MAGPELNKRKRPLARACSSNAAALSVSARVVPSNAADLRPRDTDIGKFAIIKPRKLAHALIIAPPRPDQPDETRNQHGGVPCICCGPTQGRAQPYIVPGPKPWHGSCCAAAR